jgi:hypothetical protein
MDVRTHAPPTKDFKVKRAAKPQAKPQEVRTDGARPTISLNTVIATNTGSFSGWGPKVNGSGQLLKNWN